MVQDINQELDRLNGLLAGVTPYRLGLAPPGEFKPADINARFMNKNTYDQLVGNIKKDKNLSSVPFCWVDPGGEIHTLSGHHRVDAARDAGIELVLFLYTDQELTEEQRTAIQISHNSLVGEDNPDILKLQWESIRTLDMKLYSGLDDRVLKTFEPVDLSAYNEKDLRFKIIELMFLPEEIEELKQDLDKITRSARLRWVAPQELFENFTQTLMTFKDATRIFNTATAFAEMVRVTRMYCDYLDELGQVGPEELEKIRQNEH